jgi:hypothetical protein
MFLGSYASLLKHLQYLTISLLTCLQDLLLVGSRGHVRVQPFCPSSRGLSIPTKRSKMFSSRSQLGMALLFKMILATKKESEVDKRGIIQSVPGRKVKPFTIMTELSLVLAM